MPVRVKAGLPPLLWLASTACVDPLVAKNLSDPDIERVFGDPAVIEQAIGSGYQVCRNNNLEANVYQQLLTMSLESHSQINNYLMGPVGTIPRQPIQNTKAANQAEGGRFAASQRNARLVAYAIGALDALLARPGSDGLDTPGRNARARAFGFFVMACNLGYGAAVWDSLAAIDHLMSRDSIPPLESGEAVMVKTLALLDSALVQANLPAATGSGGFPLPATWMGGYTLGRDDFVKLVNTHKARFRTAVARTKAARDGVDWGKVLAEAEAGLDHDIDAFVGGASGWSIGFQSSVMHIGAGWSQLSMMYYGFADTSGAYQTWLQLPLHQRGYILLCTPDLRWPRGCTRPAQQATSPQPSTWTDLPYIGNRLDPDVAGEPWGNSYYQNQRYVYIRNNSNTGQYPEFLRAENDMLVAEAAIRLGQFSKAAARIDIYRSHAGLPLLTGAINDATTPVPGGNACVPKVPDPDTKVLRCGALMEAMKYEKRMETAFNRVGAWYFDSRGWGDLIEGTPLEYPLPVNEIDARYPTTLPYYNLGGGGPSSAPRGTYGFP